MVLGLNSDLPHEVLNILPNDPLQQLELAHKITTYAYAQRVAQAETEAQQLREAVISKQNTIKTLERRVMNLEVEVQELLAKNKQSVEEQHKLQTERGALVETVKRLNRDIAKLEAFKRSLRQHLEDEETSPLERPVPAVDMSTERMMTDVLQSVSKPMLSPTAGNGHLTGGSHQSYATRGGSTTSASAYRAPSPAPTPTYNSSPRHLHASHQQQPSPYDSGYQDSQQQQGGGYMSAANGSATPASSASLATDSKEFFKQARTRLSYEQFSQFLISVKELNAGRVTREETLRQVHSVFGLSHPDLFAAFEALLHRPSASGVP